MELPHAFYTDMTYVAVPQVGGTIITIFWHEHVYHYDRDFNEPFILGARPLKVLFKKKTE